jgi:hypothetical protein
MGRSRLPRGDALRHALLLLPAAAGVGLLSWSTPNGVGLALDSFHYISAARNLIAGYGLGRLTCYGFKPLTMWPPLYPIVLATFRIGGYDAIRAARAISALGFGATVALAGVLVLAMRGRTLFALMTSGLVLMSGPMLRTFSWAMSEALFMPLCLAALLILGKSLETGNRRAILTASLVAGCAMITRYVGVSLFIAATILILLNVTWSSRRRAENLLLLVPGGAPVILWLVRNRLVAGSATNRVLEFTLSTPLAIRPIISSMVDWFIPRELPLPFGTLLFVCLWILLLTLTVRAVFMGVREGYSKGGVYTVVLLFILAYPAVFVLTVFFVLPSVVTLEERFLAPLLVGLLILAGGVASHGWDRLGSSGKAVIVAVAAALLLSYSQRDVPILRAMRADGQGFASGFWVSSKTGELLRQLPQSTVYTNNMSAVYFLSGKPSCGVPGPDSPDGLAAMRADLKKNDGLLILFGAQTKEFMPFGEMTQGMMALDVHEGAIFEFPR